MKILLIICAVGFGFLAVSLIYSTANGYTVWYWRNFHAEILVDGHPVLGYIHQSRNRVLLTRRDSAKPHSYFLNLEQYYALDCDSWPAPSFFVVPLGHVNHPCFGNDIIGADFAKYNEPEAPADRIKVDGSSFEFHTSDGKLVRVTR
jgi:hypothetical protein